MPEKILLQYPGCVLVYAALMVVSYQCFRQPIGPIFKDPTDGVSKNFGNKLPISAL